MQNFFKAFTLSALVYLIVFLTPSLSAQSTDLPVFVPSPCPVAFQNEVECGTVIVPQDRLHPEERTVSLAVAIFKAQSSTPAPDPILFLDGGPGARTLDSYASGLNSLLATINISRDVIAFDYRGMGYSDPNLICPEAVEAADGWIAACRARFEAEGIDLTDYTTRDNAADAADIARALGYESYNIWGGSYGSSVALTLLRDHPQNIRAAIITAVQPPQSDLQASSVVYNLRTLGAISELCQADAACSAVFPGDLVEQLGAVVERLEADPIPVEGGGELDGIDILVALSELIKDDANIPIIPAFVAALHAGQYDAVLPYANVLSLPTLPPSPYGAWLSMRCTDSILATTTDAIETALQAVHPAIRASFLEVHQWQVDQCETWGARVPTDEDRQPAVTDTPVLIISGALDPFSSQEWLDSALATLPDGHGFMLPYHMHFVIQNPCAAGLLVDFIDDPAAEPDADCLAAVEPPSFGGN